MQRSLPGQQAGSSLAYQHDGVSLSGRTVNAGAMVRAGGADWVGEELLFATASDVACGATKKNGDTCVAKPVGDHDHCIGHLSRGSEGIA